MRAGAAVTALLGAALVTVSTALAAGSLGVFEDAFPMRPCMDGWAGCRVDEQPVDAELRGTPAHWRVDWWSLGPTGSFSPFPELSRYPAPPGATDNQVDPVVIDIAGLAELDEEDTRAARKRRARAARRRALRSPGRDADDSCTDLTAIEPTALAGKLSDGQRQCLENNLSAAEKMTDKDKISRVLMVDAYVSGDKGRWEGLVRRHLDEINRSDPDLAYKYAGHLSRRGPSRALGVIHWATVALENKTVWTGDTFTSRVSSLHRMRAQAAAALWRAAEEEYASDPNDEVEVKAERYRDQTKTYAREWAAYCKSAGKDTSLALELCHSAAGSGDACAL